MPSRFKMYFSFKNVFSNRILGHNAERNSVTTEIQQTYGTNGTEIPQNNIIGTYSGRTKYSAFVSKLNKLSEEYLSPQKTQKAAVFFIRKILARRLI